MKFERYLPKSQLYRISSGENIQQIADRFNTSLDNIECKSVNSYFEGEFIEIKKCNQATHIVKPLENITDIAEKYKVTVEYIIQNNDLKTKKLFIGQKLRL